MGRISNSPFLNAYAREIEREKEEKERLEKEQKRYEEEMRKWKEEQKELHKYTAPTITITKITWRDRLKKNFKWDDWFDSMNNFITILNRLFLK